MGATPPIRYATTRDNQRIAYWEIGQGSAIVSVPYVVWGDLESEWQVPALRDWYERLSRHHRVIRFDARGSGLSQGASVPFRLEDVALDIEAVAGEAESITLIAEQGGWIPAAQLFELRPDLIDRIVLLSPVAKWAEYEQRSGTTGFQLVAAHDWHAYSVMVPGLYGFAEEASKTAFASMIEASGRPEGYAGRVSSILHGARKASPVDLALPVLVLHGRRSIIQEDMVRDFAASLPRGTLRLFDGSALTLPAGDIDLLAREIETFIGESVQANPGTFRTILFTDVVASTPLLAQLKDEKMRALMRDHDEVLAAAVTDHGGRVIKTIGDAFMADFATPSAAVEAAIRMQRGIREGFADSDVRIRLRVGINAGEPIEEDGDLHGLSVVIAKRLESKADANGILVSDVVKQAVVGKRFEFEDRGELSLTGFDEPVRAWSVVWA